MARPRLTDRDAIAAASLSVRLTAGERTRWDAFVARQSAALRGTGARVTAASLARDVLVARLDAEGIPAAADTATPATSTQQGLPFDTPPVVSAEAPAADPPSPPAAPVKEEEGGPFWYGIGLGPGAVEFVHPRRGQRGEVEPACRELGVTLRGPFETHAVARLAFERERADQERRANAPPPPPPAPPPPPPAPPPSKPSEPPVPTPQLAAEPVATPKRAAAKKTAKKAVVSKAAMKKVKR